MIDEKALKNTIGLADAYELLANASAFPNKTLAYALSDGRLVTDAQSCLEDCGIGFEEASIICEPWRTLVGIDSDTLLSGLRRAYSLLFVRQGNGVAVWPYESAFLHVKAGRDGEPALFRSSVTLAVEKMMSETGGLPQDARTEPCDSVWNEFMFLSHLLGCEAEAIVSGNEAVAALAHDRTEAFIMEHASRWIPDFFNAVERELPAIAKPESIPDRYYKGLCEYSAQIMQGVHIHL